MSGATSCFIYDGDAGCKGNRAKIRRGQKMVGSMPERLWGSVISYMIYSMIPTAKRLSLLSPSCTGVSGSSPGPECGAGRNVTLECLLAGVELLCR